MSDPAFLQFAERCKDICENEPYGSEVAAMAERHARLLAAVWEWANSPVGFPPPFSEHVKVYIRSLLADEQGR